MKSVNFNSTQLLSCAPCNGEIVICVDNTLTLSGKPYIDGQVASTQTMANQRGQCVYVYGFIYDEAQLLHPETALLDTDIHGVFCRGCLTEYIDATASTTVCDSAHVNSGTLVVCNGGDSGLLSGLEGQVPVVVNSETGEIEFISLPGATNPCANQTVSEGALLVCNGGNPSPLAPSVLGQVPVVTNVGSGTVEFQNINSRIVFTIGDGVNEITTGPKKCLEITQNCVITGWKLLSDDPSTTAGDIVIDVYNDVYANYPPTVLKTIIDTGSGGVKPNIAATNSKGASVNVNHWTTAISAGDILRFNVDTVHTLMAVTLILEVTIL